MRLALSILALALVAGCAAHEPLPKIPMSSIWRTARPERSRTLIVFLPGHLDREGVFQRKGFFSLVRKHKLPVDLVAADAHVAYYEAGTVVRRLHNDVIEPALRRGYEQIVLVGVSMGGYGALRYAMTYPHEVSMVVLLSPFLGAGSHLREVADPADPDFSETWKWLSGYSPEGRKEGRPRLILAFGKEDILLRTDHKLQAMLPPNDVLTAFGAHVWGTWHTLFNQILDKRLLLPEGQVATVGQSVPHSR